MEYKDYYKILGVDKKATEKEIKSAYRKLAKKYHPDINSSPDAEARFKEVNEANEVLSDPEKRAKYDQLGADWKRWQHQGVDPNDFWSQFATGGGAGGPRVRVQYGGSAGDMFGGGAGADVFSDFFNAIFGGMGGAAAAQQAGGGFGGFNRASQSRRGQDLEHEVEISLTEAYLGTVRVVNKDGQRLNVKIPAGVKTGSKVRVRGKGGGGVGGGQSGDLFLRIKVASDPRFERKGDDLYTTVPVDLYTAVLGGEVTVPTLAGNAKLKIPAGTQNNQKFRLRGKGMPSLKNKGRYGDLYARIEVRLPAKLTSQQRKLFEELRKTS